MTKFKLACDVEQVIIEVSQVSQQRILKSIYDIANKMKKALTVNIVYQTMITYVKFRYHQCCAKRIVIKCKNVELYNQYKSIATQPVIQYMLIAYLACIDYCIVDKKHSDTVISHLITHVIECVSCTFYTILFCFCISYKRISASGKKILTDIHWKIGKYYLDILVLYGQPQRPTSSH